MNTKKIIDLINDPNTSPETVAEAWLEEAKGASEPEHTRHLAQVMTACTLPREAYKIYEVNKLIIGDPHVRGMIQAFGKHPITPTPRVSSEIILSPRHLSPCTYEILNRWSRAFEMPGVIEEEDGNLLVSLSGHVSLDNPLTRRWRIQASTGPDASPDLADIPDLAAISTWLFRNNIQYALLDQNLGGPIVADLGLYDPAPSYRGASHDHQGGKIIIHHGKRE